MEVHVFKNLCDKLKSMNLLVDDKKVSVEEGDGDVFINSMPQHSS